MAQELKQLPIKHKALSAKHQYCKKKKNRKEYGNFEMYPQILEYSSF
jgi:hypothetical protein